MRKIKITYPQVYFEEKEIEVTQEQYESLILHLENQDGFIWDNLDEREQSWVPDGEKGLSAAIEYGYCGVFEAEESKEKQY